MSNEIMYIGESEAERLAYDGLEDLCAVWRIRAASKLMTASEQPFELARRTLRGKVNPLAKRRPAAVTAPRQSVWRRMAAAVSSLFAKELSYA
jgi:hypothetical protein